MKKGWSFSIPLLPDSDMNKGGRPRSPNPSSLPEGYPIFPEQSPPDVSLFDPTSSGSLFSFVEDSIGEAIRGIPPKLLTMTEAQLRKEVKPDETLCRLKLSFWDEYELAREANRKMQISKVVRGVCQRQFFYDVVLPNPKYLAWVVTPPLDHMLQMREILDLGLKRLRKMIQVPFVWTEKKVLKDGTEVKKKVVNAAAMGQINTAVSTLIDRVHGSVVQKVQQESKNLNLNVETTKNELEGASLETLERMESALLNMQHAISGTLPSPREDVDEVIDVTADDGEDERDDMVIISGVKQS